MRSRSWSEKPTSEISLTAYRLHQESSKTVQAASNGDCEKEGAAACQAHAIKETRHSLFATSLLTPPTRRRRQLGCSFLLPISG